MQYSEREENLLIKRNRLRDEWNDVRTMKLNRRDVLLQQGDSRREMRNDKEYKILRKRQAHLSKMIKHMDMRINRARAASNEK